MCKLDRTCPFRGAGLAWHSRPASAGQAIARTDTSCRACPPRATARTPDPVIQARSSRPGHPFPCPRVPVSSGWPVTGPAGSNQTSRRRSRELLGRRVLTGGITRDLGQVVEPSDTAQPVRCPEMVSQVPGPRFPIRGIGARVAGIGAGLTAARTSASSHRSCPPVRPAGCARVAVQRGCGRRQSGGATRGSPAGVQTMTAREWTRGSPEGARRGSPAGVRTMTARGVRTVAAVCKVGRRCPPRPGRAGRGQA